MTTGTQEAKPRVPLRLGYEIIRSYKRLNYTAWHALAEFVDNSTQSYFDHKSELDRRHRNSKVKLRVSITYDSRTDHLRIEDDAMGMNLQELERALHIGQRFGDISGRSRYGMGMKTAAFWFGDKWSITTTRLNDPHEYYVELDVNRISSGDFQLDVDVRPASLDEHGTVIEIWNLGHPLRTRTQSKVRDFLSSMYRMDLEAGWLELSSLGETPLEWHPVQDRLQRLADGSPYMRNFEFGVNGKRVTGWAGILERGSRAQAGFSILHANRVVRGWPESWRPQEIFGQIQGTNNLLNQRLVGEVHLDDFEVSHTKNDIVWVGDDEEDVELGIKARIQDLIVVANRPRRAEDQRGPTPTQVKIAVGEIQAELISPELADVVLVEPAPNHQMVAEAKAPMLDATVVVAPDFTATIDGLTVNGYLGRDNSVNDPYVAVDAAESSQLIVVVNMNHPHLRQLETNGFLDHLRHCVYDAIAEWLARHKGATLDPDTIKFLKDRLLRLSFEMELHSGTDSPGRRA